jgi:hypothetical protein
VRCAPSGDEAPTVYIVIQISKSLNGIGPNEKTNKHKHKIKNEIKKNKTTRKNKAIAT